MTHRALAAANKSELHKLPVGAMGKKDKWKEVSGQE